MSTLSQNIGKISFSPSEVVRKRTFIIARLQEQPSIFTKGIYLLALPLTKLNEVINNNCDYSITATYHFQFVGWHGGGRERERGIKKPY